MSGLGTFKRLLKNHLPRTILEWRQRHANRHLAGLKTGEVFARIYRENRWESAESRSGLGSELRETAAVREALPGILRELEIRSLLDVPCGDFNWMRHVDLGDCQYTGGDIVPELIEETRARYAAPGREFRTLNIITDPTPTSDLILCRDCFIHLPLRDIASALRNFKASGSRFLLTNTYPEHFQNLDIPTGGARPLNLTVAPFRFPPPLKLIHERPDIPPGTDEAADKSLGLWSIDSLPV